MNRWVVLSAVALAVAGPARAAEITGKYVEVRTCDVFTAPCFANAEINMGGKHGVLAWKVDKGRLGDVKLDGLGVVAVVATSDTLGREQTGPSKAVLLVDRGATTEQRAALVKFAKQQAGDLLGHVVKVASAKIDLGVTDCEEGGCATLDAGVVKLDTRCVDRAHDKVCGNESAFYPPLAKGVTAQAAVATEHSFSGEGLGSTWSESSRRGAYVGTFQVK
jgi:hypothetical protein